MRPMKAASTMTDTMHCNNPIKTNQTYTCIITEMMPEQLTVETMVVWTGSDLKYENKYSRDTITCDRIIAKADCCLRID